MQFGLNVFQVLLIFCSVEIVSAFMKPYETSFSSCHSIISALFVVEPVHSLFSGVDKVLVVAGLGTSYNNSVLSWGITAVKAPYPRA